MEAHFSFIILQSEYLYAKHWAFYIIKYSCGMSRPFLRFSKEPGYLKFQVEPITFSCSVGRPWLFGKHVIDSPLAEC